jgi:hypothetical protein
MGMRQLLHMCHSRIDQLTQTVGYLLALCRLDQTKQYTGEHRYIQQNEYELG